MFKEIVNFIKNNKWYVLLVVGLLGLYFYKFHGELSSNSEKWDHFGSYIGGIFSAVTLLSVLHGMQLERKRFNEQKIEQEKSIIKQSIENTFYQLLNIQIKFLHEQLENKTYGISSYFDKNGKNNTGDRGFEKKMSPLDTMCLFAGRKEEKGDDFLEDILMYVYGVFYAIEFIDNKISDEDSVLKLEYVSIVKRVLLTRKVLFVLVSMMVKNQINDKKYFIDYINKFSLLENFEFDKFIEKYGNDSIDFFNENAFGESLVKLQKYRSLK